MNPSNPVAELPILSKLLLGHAFVVSGLGGALMSIGHRTPTATLAYLYGPAMALTWLLVRPLSPKL